MSVLNTVAPTNVVPINPGAIDHGLLAGLGDDDHPQYVLADGTRNIVAAAADFTISDTAEDVLLIHRDTNTVGADTKLLFQSDDANGDVDTYYEIFSRIVANVAAAVRGRLYFRSHFAGAVYDMLVLDTTEIALNESSTNCNVRIEGNSDEYLLFCDAGNDAVTIGGTAEIGKLGVDGNADEIQFGIQGHSTQTSDVMIIEDSAGTDTLRIDQQAIFDYRGTMANSSKAPQTVAPDDWVEIKIGGTTYFLPAYLA